jgi:transcriptional regulator of acetoin/glycerol metabolism
MPYDVVEKSVPKKAILYIKETSLSKLEETLIRKVLEETGWKVRQAARELEIARGTLYSKIRKYDIKRPV